MNHIQNSVTVTQTGVSITTSATSASAALPNCASGLARGYLVTATAAAHVRLGIGAPTAVTTDVLVLPGSPPLILNRTGFTHIAAIQNAAAGVVIVTPLDD